MPIMKIMIVLGLISAILYTFFPDLFSIYEFTDSYGDRRKVSHIAFLFYRGIVGVKERLCGFFWEPGIYQIYLNIFLILQLNKYKEKLWIFATILSIILTVSTTGYIILSIILLYELFKKLHTTKNIFIVIAVMIVAAVGFGYGYKIVTGNISDKVSGENQGSFFARQADVIAGLTIAYENPLIGIGANTERFKQMRSQIAWQGELTGSQTKDEWSYQLDVYMGHTIRRMVSVGNVPSKNYMWFKVDNGRLAVIVTKFRTTCHDSIFSTIHIFRIR